MSKDPRIKYKMDVYNSFKMPTLKRTVDKEVLEQRKRSIKAELKAQAERLKYFSNHVAGLAGPALSDLNYMLGEKVTSEKLLD